MIYYKVSDTTKSYITVLKKKMAHHDSNNGTNRITHSITRLVIFELTNNMFRLNGTRIQVYCIHCSLIKFELKLQIHEDWLHIPLLLHDNLRLRFTCSVRYIQIKLYIIGCNLFFSRGKNVQSKYGERKKERVKGQFEYLMHKTPY